MRSFTVRCLICLSITITISTEHVIRGEGTRYSIHCPLPNALWYGPNNQSILINSNKYEIKSSLENLQLTINHLTSDDEGTYTCLNNETDQIIKQYDIKLATIENVLPLFFSVICSILLFIPIFCFLGRKYSGINQ